MGQAKTRGTFEQRREESRTRQEADEARLVSLYAEVHARRQAEILALPDSRWRSPTRTLSLGTSLELANSI
jgi:hypothetical protein